MGEAPYALAPERILIVDDEPDIRHLLARLLKGGGYNVSMAGSGDEALAAVQAEIPDLVLLDVSMPGMDGFAVCHELQKLGPSMPAVIFLSAFGASDARVTGLDAGAVDYVVKPFDPSEVRARVRAALRSKAMRDALALQASTDGLTGLMNRRTLDERLSEAFAVARRYGRPLSVLMVDIDHFKAVNDTYGHAAGDAVLREVASRIKAQARLADTVARYGGEEIMVLLPETDLEGAKALGERVRAAVAAAPVQAWTSGAPSVGGEADEATPVPVRVSVGVATLSAGMEGPEALMSAADAGLYAAKRAGRNRVEVG
jgi:two-component system, cell cycle response regulator